MNDKLSISNTNESYLLRYYAFIIITTLATHSEMKYSLMLSIPLHTFPTAEKNSSRS